MRQWVFQTAWSGYTAALPFFWFAFGLVVFLLLPLSFFRRTSGIAGTGLMMASYVFGITTWLLGAAASFASFGWFGLIIGILFAGIGVVPLGIIGGFFSLDSSDLALTLLAGFVITFATRFGGLFVAGRSRA